MDTAEPFSCLDHNELSELLHEHRGIRLVLIDNAELLFCDYNRPGRCRIQRQLSLLQAVAEKREVAIVLLTSIPRLSADPFRSAILSTFRDSARMVYLLAPDLQDPTAHLLFNLKNTLPDNAGVSPAWRMQLFPAWNAGVSPASAPSLLSHPTSLTYPHYLHQLHHPATRGPDPDRHDYAVEFLRLTLSTGPVLVGHRRNPDPGTLRYLADQAGAWSTILRAKKTLQITSTNTGDSWSWHLPSTIPTLMPNPSPNLAIAIERETCAPPPPDEAQLLTPSAPTAQKDICATPANIPSNSPSIDSSSRLPSRLRDFAAVSSPQPPSGVAA